jgi:hypothetical protein
MKPIEEIQSRFAREHDRADSEGRFARSTPAAGVGLRPTTADVAASGGATGGWA